MTSGERDLARRTWVLLHEVEGPVNLGSACRAMGNTGFTNLAYTGELSGDEDDARKFAFHAIPILEAARRCRDLGALLEGKDVVFGFSPRSPWSDGRNLDLDGFHRFFAHNLAAGRRIGLLFGNEAHGLQNRDLAACHYRVALPTHAGYASMNLAQAVMVVLWEIRRQAIVPAEQSLDPEFAGAEQVAALLANIHEFLEVHAFFNPQNPDHIWQEVMPLFKAREWRHREVTLLHAIFGKARSRYLALQRRYRDLQTEPGPSGE